MGVWRTVTGTPTRSRAALTTIFAALLLWGGTCDAAPSASPGHRPGLAQALNLADFTDFDFDPTELIKNLEQTDMLVDPTLKPNLAQFIVPPPRSPDSSMNNDEHAEEAMQLISDLSQANQVQGDSSRSWGSSDKQVTIPKRLARSIQKQYTSLVTDLRNGQREVMRRAEPNVLKRPKRAASPRSAEEASAQPTTGQPKDRLVRLTKRPSKLRAALIPERKKNTDTVLKINPFRRPPYLSWLPWMMGCRLGSCLPQRTISAQEPLLPMLV